MNMITREADITSVFDEAVQAHNAGDLTAAEQLYKETLSRQPDHCEANHNIGVVFAAKNELEDALKFFKFALDTSPNVSLFWASYIDVLIKLDRITESKTLIKALTDAGISCDKIKDISHKLNVLHQEPGAQECDELDELINQKKFDDAQEKCLTLLETYPSSAVLNVHLGKCYFERGHIDHAISCYTKATQYQPKWEVGFAMLAQANYSQGNLDRAIAAYEKAISLKPDYVEAYNNMGVALQNIGKVEEAIEAYEKALSLNPEYVEAYNNLGSGLADISKLDEAIEAYEKAISLKPDYAEAYKNMGVALQDIGKVEEAIEAYEKALSLKPDYANASHMLCSLTGKTTKSAPKDYVENLFNGYAQRFDNSLIKELEYDIPKTLTQIVVEDNTNNSMGSVLDLGCGTGLVGLEIQNYCKNLEGIDLSNSMLEQANQKKVYDKLTHVDIVKYLRNADLNYDYFISADVFIYVGDLHDVFHLIKSRNKCSGKLVFSTEHTEKCGFHLEQSGRYSHSKDYIEGLCTRFGYSISHFSKVGLRKEKGKFLTGGLYLLNF